MLVAWTTVAQQSDADRIAADVIAGGLAVCVQIDGPITSHYRWEGGAHRDSEFRLCFKVLEENAAALEQRVHALHPYETPEWVVTKAEHVSEKYLSWAKANSTNPPL